MAVESHIPMDHNYLMQMRREKPQNFSAAIKHHNLCTTCRGSFFGSEKMHHVDCQNKMKNYDREIKELQKKNIVISSSVVYSDDATLDDKRKKRKQKSTTYAKYALIKGGWQKI